MKLFRKITTFLLIFLLTFTTLVPTAFAEDMPVVAEVIEDTFEEETYGEEQIDITEPEEEVELPSSDSAVLEEEIQTEEETKDDENTEETSETSEDTVIETSPSETMPLSDIPLPEIEPKNIRKAPEAIVKEEEDKQKDEECTYTKIDASHAVRVAVWGDKVCPESTVNLVSEWEGDVSWQVYVERLDVWVTITREQSNSIELTLPMLLSLVNYTEGTVKIRAKSITGEISNDIEVFVTSKEEQKQAPKATPVKAPVKASAPDEGGTRGVGDEALTYNITINFIFMTGEIAADPIRVTVNAGEDYAARVTIPSIIGYTATYEGEDIEYLDISLEDVQRNYSYEIVYNPGIVTYVVEHYLQNTFDDNYTFRESETLTGYTLSEIGDVDKDYTGFYPLLYDHVQIAADSSTVIQIFYDRYYYLTEFDLDGGRGVDPIYAKYEMPITIGVPTKAGYTFAGWDNPVPSTMPLNGGVYRALWTPTETTYNVLYWYENTTGVDSYSVAGSSREIAITGTEVNSDMFQNGTFDDRDDAHFVYNPSKSETVTIAGDGTTVLNVYFDRVLITLNFYDEPLASRESSQSNTNLYYSVTGKWGATFSQSGVAWPSEKFWSFWRRDSSGSMGMTFMDAFLPTSAMGNDTTINFYTRTVSGHTIYFLKEKLDGTYASDYAVEVLVDEADNIVGINGNFTFSEKYEGFRLKDYQSNGTNYRFTYTKDGVTYPYNGMRFVSTTSTTDTPQYGLVDGEVVELEYLEEKIWYLPYTYTATTATTGTLYGIVDSEYTRLTQRLSWMYDDDQVYQGTYVYQPTTATSATVTYYGVLNGNIVALRGTGYFYGDDLEYRYSGQYKYQKASETGTTYTNNSRYTIYYLNNNGGVSSQNNAYYFNGAFYSNSNGRGTRYCSFDEAYANRSNTSAYNETTQYYAPINGEMVAITAGFIITDTNHGFTGQRYTRIDTPATSTGTVTYYGFVDGEMKLLTSRAGFVDEWGNIYQGTRYTRSNNTSANPYMGTRYVRTNASMPYSYKRTESQEGTQYGLDSNMAHQQLSYINSNGAFFYNGVRYTGTRYVETANTTGTIYGFVNGERYSLTRSQYTGFGDTWTVATVGNQITNDHDYIVRFERRKYNVEYFNYNYFLDSKKKQVKYEYGLSNCDLVPEYPYSLPYGMYEFAGWYDNQELVGEPFDFNSEIMPAHNITLYAKYVPKTLTVNVYKDLISMTEGTNLISTEQVPYDTLATPPSIPENKNYTFVGWFYRNRYGEEFPFQFSSMTVTDNLNIYGKWTSDVLATYHVKYETEDGVPVADDTLNSALAGTTRTFIAKTGRNVYPEYRTHWFPRVSSHSILISEDEPNDFTFIYVYRESVPYTVKYLDAETGEQLLPDKIVADNTEAYVTEQFEYISGYIPDAYQKSLEVSIEGDNTIIFYYTQNDTQAPYVVNHYIETDEGYVLYNYQTGIGNIGATIDAQILDIGGYEHNPSVPGTVLSGTLPATGLELNVYYDRIQYPYMVRYLEVNTERVLAEPDYGTGYYDQVFSFNYKPIEGYDLVSPETQNLIIRQEFSENPRNNILTFYYRVEQSEIHYVPIGDGTVDLPYEYIAIIDDAEGSTAIPNPGATFIGWFKDAACTIPVTDADGTIDENNKFVPAKVDGRYISTTYYAKFSSGHSITVTKTVTGSFGSRSKDFEFVLRLSGDLTGVVITYTKGDTSGVATFVNGEFAFTLAHGESITFNDVPSGITYEIVELDANQNAYTTTIDGPASGTLTSDITVNFTNDRDGIVPTNARVPWHLSIFFGCATIITAALIIFRKKKRRAEED